MTRQLLAAAMATALVTMLAACNKPAPTAETPAGASTSTAPATTTAAPASTGSEAAAKPAPTDFDQLAKRVVANAGIKEGEIVMITGRGQDAELLEDLAVATRSVGAFPMILYSSDRLSKRLFFDVPEKYDAQMDALDMKMANVANVVISLGNGMSENLFEGADPKRMAARGKANEPVAQMALKNNVRTVEIGNNLYPTPWRAERYGMKEDELSTIFWNGVNLDYSELQSRGEQVKNVLASGGEVHITNPNGTDLKLNVKGRKVLVSDGIISEADRKAGGAAASIYLPAGEVYTTPVSGSAEGKVVHSRTYYRGKQIDNLTLTISGGKVTAMTGTGPGFADFKAEYDAVNDPRKDLFAFIDLGINPNVKLPATSTTGTWVPAGTVTVGTGSNAWAGGDNSVPYSNVIFLPGSTVTLDGKTIVENGSLKL
jgi:aminopeptidase